MIKKTYLAPEVNAFSLVSDETLLSLSQNSGDNLVRVGDYDDVEFDDLFE